MTRMIVHNSTASIVLGRNFAVCRAHVNSTEIEWNFAKSKGKRRRRGGGAGDVGGDARSGPPRDYSRGISKWGKSESLVPGCEVSYR